MVVRWPGVIKPGTVKNQLFAARIFSSEAKHE
jgi:hypothetical protein